MVWAPATLQLELRPCYNKQYTNYNYVLQHIVINYNYCLQKTNLSVYIAFSSSLSTKHNWHHNRHNHALHTNALNRWVTALRACNVFEGLRVCMVLKALLCSSNDELPQHQSVLRAINTSTATQIISACLGGCCTSIESIGAKRKASCGPPGGHCHRPWHYSGKHSLLNVKIC